MLLAWVFKWSSSVDRVCLVVKTKVYDFGHMITKLLYPSLKSHVNRAISTQQSPSAKEDPKIQWKALVKADLVFKVVKPRSDLVFSTFTCKLNDGNVFFLSAVVSPTSDFFSQSLFYPAYVFMPIFPAISQNAPLIRICQRKYLESIFLIACFFHNTENKQTKNIFHVRRRGRRKLKDVGSWRWRKTLYNKICSEQKIPLKHTKLCLSLSWAVIAG